MFDFNSFRAMVDTIGGVEVCVPARRLPRPVLAGCNLRGGKHLLTYNQALAYVRTRHGVSAEGDAGGDLPRIELQQAFMSSVIQKVNSQGILSNSVQLLKIADTATRALTVDQGLDSVSKLLGLARSLTHLRAKNVTLVDHADGHRPGATSAGCCPRSRRTTSSSRCSSTASRGITRLPTLPPGQVQVRVLNGTGIRGPGLPDRPPARAGWAST